MTAPGLARLASVSIGAIRVRAASGLDARRLADALPAALDVALADGAVRPLRPSPAERAAWAVADAVRAERERRT